MNPSLIDGLLTLFAIRIRIRYDAKLRCALLVSRYFPVHLVGDFVYGAVRSALYQPQETNNFPKIINRYHFILTLYSLLSWLTPKREGRYHICVER